MQQGIRQIAKGSTSVAALSTVTLATITRNTGELLSVYAFIATNTAGIELYQGVAPTLADRVGVYLEKTANANEVLLRANNTNSTTARTVDWMVTGIVPV